MGVHKREYTANGKPVWEYEFRLHYRRYSEAGFATEREAKEAEQKRLRELNSKTARPVENDKVSLEQFVPKFVAHRRVIRSEETAIREERRVRPLLRAYGKRRLAQITTADIHDFVARRKEDDGLKNRSINLELTVIRSLFRYAIECGFASENPAAAVKNLKEHYEEKWCPSVEEFLRFVEAAKKTESAVVFVPWLWFRAYTGTRPKESVFVEWKDMDFVNDRIRICRKPGNQLKNKASNRYIGIHPELKPILLEWKAKWDEVFARRHERHPDEPHPPHDWVFYNPYDQKRRLISFLRCFQQARKAAGLPKMTSHTLRHYFISQAMMSKDVNPYAISKFVGHSGTKMIEQVYGHLRSDYLQEQMGRVSIVGTPSGVGTNGQGGVPTEKPTAVSSPTDGQDRGHLRIVGE